MQGPACTANAFIGQFTVQATDFNILLISIVVLLTVTNQYVYSRPSQSQIAMLCVAPWIPSVITGTRSHPFNIKEEASTNPRPSKHRPRPPRLRSHIRQLVLDNTSTRNTALRPNARLADRNLPDHHLHLHLRVLPPHEDIRQHLGADARNRITHHQGRRRRIAALSHYHHTTQDPHNNHRRHKNIFNPHARDQNLPRPHLNPKAARLHHHHHRLHKRLTYPLEQGKRTAKVPAAERLPDPMDSPLDPRDGEPRL